MLANAEVKIAPAAFSALNSPAPSNARRVLHESAKSAEPPASHGTFLARTFNTWLEASRVAIPLASATNSGKPRSHPSGNSRRSIR
jgi:hypothetical protein